MQKQIVIELLDWVDNDLVNKIKKLLAAKLAKIGKLDILKELFGEIVIPKAV